MDKIGNDSSPLHEIKNHLSVIAGICDLLLREMPEQDSRRKDILQMRKAGEAAISLLPQLEPPT